MQDIIFLNPFGMIMPGRSYDGGSGYRYGYQGSEEDKEVHEGSYTTHFRQLDTRIGRWLSVDPATSALSWQSPYVSMDNNPISFNDVMGDTSIVVIKQLDGDVTWEPQVGSEAEIYQGGGDEFNIIWVGTENEDGGVTLDQVKVFDPGPLYFIPTPTGFTVSSLDITKGIPEDYNESSHDFRYGEAPKDRSASKTPYRYDLTDLTRRFDIFQNPERYQRGSRSVIENWETQGEAQAITRTNANTQYYYKNGTNSAIYLGGEYLSMAADLVGPGRGSIRGIGPRSFKLTSSKSKLMPPNDFQGNRWSWYRSNVAKGSIWFKGSPKARMVEAGRRYKIHFGI